MLACFACHSCGFSEHPASCGLALWAFAQVWHLGRVVLTSARSPDYLRTQCDAFHPARYQGTNVDISNKELSGGARIFYIFNDVFGHALAIIESTQSLEIQDIRTAICNSTGPRPSLLVPEVAFDLLVKPQIRLLEAPSLRCVEPVYEKLARSAIITRAQYVPSSGAALQSWPDSCASGIPTIPTAETVSERPRTAWPDFSLRPEPHRRPGCIHQHPPCICDSNNASFAYAARISGLQRIWTSLSGEKIKLRLTLCADHACARPSRNPLRTRRRSRLVPHSVGMTFQEVSMRVW